VNDMDVVNIVRRVDQTDLIFTSLRHESAPMGFIY
jgi:hypothetical protein